MQLVRVLPQRIGETLSMLIPPAKVRGCVSPGNGVATKTSSLKAAVPAIVDG